MSGDNDSGQYNQKFNTALQWMWGDGFLSPGGPEEVATMLEDVDIRGLKVLDIGSGLGAIDVLLALEYGAASVLGVDVEAHLIEEGRQRASRAGVSDQVRFQLVEPGPLSFADASYDVIFTKDAIVHIPDKAAFYREVLRVLKPGGYFVGSDWLRGDEQTLTARAKKWLEIVHLNFQMRDIAHTSQAMIDAGFSEPRFNDRNAWYQQAIVHEIASVSGDRLDALAAQIGETEAQYRRTSSLSKQEAIDDGFLRPTHFVTQKPLS
jgi:ubiquinone/menaquinone biosynthesis C-methylase UbiE